MTMTITETVIKEALAAGFTSAAPLNPKKLDFMPEVRVMCAADKCRNYDKSWSCPPACGTLEEISQRVRSYDSGVLLQTTASLSDSFDYESMIEAQKSHAGSLNVLTEKLRSILPDILALGTGGCRICKECTYPSSPCRFPDRMMASMEACGLLVSRVCENCGIPYYYGPGTMTYVACVLFREEALGSRQNLVMPCHNGDTPAVRKTFSSDARLECEMNNMAVLASAGLSVPKLYTRDGSSVLYEMLAGDTLLQLLESGEFSDEAVASLAEWLVLCWEALKKSSGEPRILGDIHLANFIWNGERVTGFDLEECRAGFPEEDIGLLLAFIVTYQPPFSEYEFGRAEALVRELRSRIKLDAALLEQALRDSFNLLFGRRNLPPDPDNTNKAIDRLLSF